ncbi:endonuclease I family protein [Candidatus Uabimicrobium amorphum]|uniref:Endonuclease I n=1 Tax=Uabimicrobium amorphum TaxID=2596890 RepID=A0A5S9IQX3_UABAM|nr:endonuclease [Candidatus Uabimicrobium amorphum]BBM86429.1 endonuclease I [Candidatus Uabimicrobium amorphum]
MLTRYMFVLLLVFSCLNAEETISKRTLTMQSVEGIELQFSADTFVGDNSYIVVKNENEELARFAGKTAASQKLLVLGNFVDVHITTDTEDNYHIDFVYTRAVDYLEVTPRIRLGQFGELRDRDLKDELYNLVKGHTSLGYTSARTRMFSEIDNRSGYVDCVYTDLVMQTKGIPDHTVMNTEHTWPKSRGAKSEPAKSDLHHLFPTDSKANSRRSSYYFGSVVDIVWQDGESLLGRDSGGFTVFTPPRSHRGDVARALFYFSIRYRKEIPSFEERILKEWHRDDPVDQKEVARNDGISRYQKNRNPFIDDSSLVDRISDF